MSQRPQSISIKKSEDFRQLYCIGASGGFTPFDFRISFYNDSASIEEGKMKIERTANVEIILSPVAAKSLAQWLNVHVQNFEKQFGLINVPTQPKKSSNDKEFREGSAALWT